jgi:hypothetical protein
MAAFSFGIIYCILHNKCVLASRCLMTTYPAPTRGIIYCFLVMVQLRWRVALLCFFPLLFQHVGAGNTPSCKPCKKSSCVRQSCGNDLVLDACNCCETCPLMEGEVCGDRGKSLQVRCHPDLVCVPLNDSTAIGVCHSECMSTPGDK